VSVRRLAPAASLLAIACNALTGVGDLQTDPCADGSCVDAGTGTRTEPTPEASTVDAGADATRADAAPDAAPLPSFCSGVTFYLPFESSLVSQEGVAPDAPPAVTYVAGKFGKAVDLSNGNISVFYPTSVSGKSTYSRAAGTVAMWVKPTWTPPENAQHVLFKPKMDKTNAIVCAGPFVENIPAGLSTAVDLPDSGVAQTQPTTGGWQSGAYNHLVATWNQSASSLTLTINGGAAVSSATVSWVPNEATANFLRVGSDGYGSASVFDEVVVWSRELSQAEIAALYASPVAFGPACGL
jgi:hypothetical protein